jgi:lysophospholipase L1-like esterase
MRHIVCVSVALLALTVLASVSGMPRAVSAASTVGPKTYYLALGDSLAYGDQPTRDYSHGYADDVFVTLQSLGTKQLVNMGCPGETSSTFINGGCPYSNTVKVAYAVSQLAAAISFIRQHRGHVSPVTIDIGANDVFRLMNQSACSVSTNVDSALATFDTNFTTILRRLQKALGGKGDLVTMNMYDPYENQCANSLTVFQSFNQHVARDAARFGVPVADIFGAFGGVTTPNLNICTYTWLCSSSNIHPTTAGYSVMADSVERTLGYRAR